MAKQALHSQAFVNEENKSSGSNHFNFKITEICENKENCVNAILVDSGATSHIICDEKKFTRFSEKFNHTKKHTLELAISSRSGDLIKTIGEAQVEIIDTNGIPRKAVLHNALYVPSFNQDIFSVRAATENGVTISFSKDSGNLHSNGTNFGIYKRNNLYYLDLVSSVSVSSPNNVRPLKEWHEVMGHCNVRDLISLQNTVDGMIISDALAHKDFECETCVRAEMTNETNKSPRKKTSEPLDHVHLDLADPVDLTGYDGFRYALVCVDDFTDNSCVYLLKNKADAILGFKTYLSDMAPYGRVKSIRSDQGGEFESKEIHKLFLDNKFVHERSAPHSPHQNGTAERQWRTLFEMSGCLLIDSKLPKSLWPYALMCSSFIRNRCFNTRLTMTPLEPNLAKMHTFGKACFAMVQNPKKLSDKAEKGIFVGYDKRSPAYTVYFPQTENVKKVRNVKFLNKVENEMLNENENFDEEQDSVHTIHKPNAAPDQNVSDTGNVDYEPVTHDNIPDKSNDDMHEEISNSNARNTKTRKKTKPKYLDDYESGSEFDEC